MNPKIEKTHLCDVLIMSGDSFTDERGLFMEAYNSTELYHKARFNPKYYQDNIAISKPNVLRGLHIQRNLPQGKFVRCIQGRIRDVIVDLRVDSPTFKKMGAFELSGDNKKALWVPPGFAHGYYSYDDSIVYYKCSTLYDKKSDGGINPFDRELGIEWPSEMPIMTDKDTNLPSMSEWLKGE